MSCTVFVSPVGSKWTELTSTLFLFLSARAAVAEGGRRGTLYSLKMAGFNASDVFEAEPKPDAQPTQAMNQGGKSRWKGRRA